MIRNCLIATELSLFSYILYFEYNDFLMRAIAGLTRRTSASMCIIFYFARYTFDRTMEGNELTGWSVRGRNRENE